MFTYMYDIKFTSSFKIHKHLCTAQDIVQKKMMTQIVCNVYFIIFFYTFICFVYVGRFITFCSISQEPTFEVVVILLVTSVIFSYLKIYIYYTYIYIYMVFPIFTYIFCCVWLLLFLYLIYLIHIIIYLQILNVCIKCLDNGDFPI